MSSASPLSFISWPARLYRGWLTWLWYKHTNLNVKVLHGAIKVLTSKCIHKRVAINNVCKNIALIHYGVSQTLAQLA